MVDEVLVVADEDLFGFDEGYEKAEVKKNNFGEPPPDGDYVVRVDKVNFLMKESKLEDGTVIKKPVIKFFFKIEEGDYKGRLLFKDSYVTNKTLAMVKSELQTLGLVLKPFSQLNTRYIELLDKGAKVTKRVRPDNERFYNVYINKAVELTPVEQEEEPDDADRF